MYHTQLPVQRYVHKRQLLQHLNECHPELTIHIGPPLHKRPMLELEELHVQLHNAHKGKDERGN